MGHDKPVNDYRQVKRPYCPLKNSPYSFVAKTQPLSLNKENISANELANFNLPWTSPIGNI